ncbi:hypothetical protein V8E54_015098 [Elaphomyces granulatus]
MLVGSARWGKGWLPRVGRWITIQGDVVGTYEVNNRPSLYVDSALWRTEFPDLDDPFFETAEYKRAQKIDRERRYNERLIKKEHNQKRHRTNRAVAVAEKNTGIADGYLLWDRKRPDCDDRESGDKENEVMRLATQHLSAVTLGRSPWPETSARLLSDLTAILSAMPAAWPGLCVRTGPFPFQCSGYGQVPYTRSTYLFASDRCYEYGRKYRRKCVSNTLFWITQAIMTPASEHYPK